jgi:hypothetical protein
LTRQGWADYYYPEKTRRIPMQLFGRGREEDPDEFWRQTAEKRGGEIGFRTFATLLGRSADQQMDLPGLLYTVGDMVWFEDFEKDNWLGKLLGGRKKFEKTEMSFSRREVLSARLVSRGSAVRCIAGAVPAEKLSPVSAVGRVLSTPIVQVALSSASSLFFDMIARKEFIELLAAPPPQ